MYVGLGNMDCYFSALIQTELQLVSGDKLNSFLKRDKTRSMRREPGRQFLYNNRGDAPRV